MILYIDFDHTIHDNNNIPEGRKMGPPLPNAVWALQNLYELGHEIVIFTVRATDERSIKVVSDWLAYFKVPFTRITNIKGPADFYIDDKALRFTGDWTKTVETVVAL